LMSLEWRGNQPGDGHQHHSEGRAAELDAKIRGWPRHEGNDPYKAGLERLAAVLKPLIPTELFAIGYNEFCQPSIAEAIAGVIRQGATRVVVLPTMMTPGGVHSERDIPRALDEVRRAHPGVTIDYLWPFDLASVAQLLAEHVRRTLTRKSEPSSPPR
ncbi:MAG: CbiX/SirB N-terminal domain-containing protein, partial [Candidatus Omnitrophota bacterium]|nr:CbiX/SirB N-terminal domain-containing protein [Candidatus Omnitrophota bacterium]